MKNKKTKRRSTLKKNKETNKKWMARQHVVRQCEIEKLNLNPLIKKD